MTAELDKFVVTSELRYAEFVAYDSKLTGMMFDMMAVRTVTTIITVFQINGTCTSILLLMCRFSTDRRTENFDWLAMCDSSQPK